MKLLCRDRRSAKLNHNEQSCECNAVLLLGKVVGSFPSCRSVAEEVALAEKFVPPETCHNISSLMRLISVPGSGTNDTATIRSGKSKLTTYAEILAWKIASALLSILIAL